MPSPAATTTSTDLETSKTNRLKKSGMGCSFRGSSRKPETRRTSRANAAYASTNRYAVDVERRRISIRAICLNQTRDAFMRLKQCENEISSFQARCVEILSTSGKKSHIINVNLNCNRRKISSVEYNKR